MCYYANLFNRDAQKQARDTRPLIHFASVDVYIRKTFPNCKTADVYTRFAALF